MQVLPRLVVLGRHDCRNTSMMRANLDAALRSLRLPRAYEFVEFESLNAADPRRGYGVPTILIAATDLFGGPAPAVPDASST